MVCSCEGAQLRGHTWNMYFLNEVEDNFYLLGIPMFAENRDDSQQSNDELLKLFLSAKQVEGCSERSLKYYRTTLSKMIVKIDKSVRHVETNDIRAYISDYENEHLIISEESFQAFLHGLRMRIIL